MPLQDPVMRMVSAFALVAAGSTGTCPAERIALRTAAAGAVRNRLLQIHRLPS
jgi:hypothetical protein